MGRLVCDGLGDLIISEALGELVLSCVYEWEGGVVLAGKGEIPLYDDDLCHVQLHSISTASLFHLRPLPFYRQRHTILSGIGLICSHESRRTSSSIDLPNMPANPATQSAIPPTTPSETFCCPSSSQAALKLGRWPATSPTFLTLPGQVFDQFLLFGHVSSVVSATSKLAIGCVPSARAS